MSWMQLAPGIRQEELRGREDDLRREVDAVRQVSPLRRALRRVRRVTER
jgi:hypothetical protein